MGFSQKRNFKKREFNKKGTLQNRNFGIFFSQSVLFIFMWDFVSILWSSFLVKIRFCEITILKKSLLRNSLFEKGDVSSRFWFILMWITELKKMTLLPPSGEFMTIESLFPESLSLTLFILQLNPLTPIFYLRNVISPWTELHITRLLIKRIIPNINIACRFQYSMT